MSNQTSIVPTENGPFQVTGAGALKGLMDGKEYDASQTVYLCRCGDSSKKPFCDGTHTKNGFSGAKESDRAPDKREDYSASGVTIHDNRGLCSHAGRCTDGLKTVFKLGEEP